MRKFVKAGLAGLAALMLMTGCGAKEQTATPSDAESKAEGGEEASEEYIAEGSITLGEYKNLPVTVVNPTVSDEELQGRIDTVLGGYATWDAVDREAADGDRVKIDYKGLKDGEAFEGGTAEGYTLVLGSNTFIDGFEEGLIGVKAGEERDLNLTFPEDYREESLAGQPVVFEVTVNSVKEEQEAELNDDFVKRVSKEEYQTVDAYKESIREDLLDQKQSAAEQDMEEGALQSVISSSEFKLSRNGLSVRYNQMVKEYTNQAKMYGMSFSQMAQANGMNEPAMKEYIYDSVEEAAKRELTVEAIAANEGLDQITDEDRELFAQENGMSKDTLINMYGQEQADEYVLQDKVLYYLASNAVNEAENPAKVSERVLEKTEASPEAE